MFTGIIEGLGKITAIAYSKVGGKLSISSSFSISDLAIGDSIAVNGVCLTATNIQEKNFEAYVSPETLKKTVLQQVKIGNLVNLERAIKLSDRLNGHIVSGHVDGISYIKNKKNVGHATVLTFSISKSLSQYMINKGSIAVDGISLTINHCNNSFFDVSIIPHTLEMTTLNIKKIGDWVNIETDIIGKYTERFIKNNFNSRKDENIKQSNINIAFLSENGFT